MSIGSLYQYFPNKDALVVALDLRHLDHAEAGCASSSPRSHATSRRPPSGRSASSGCSLRSTSRISIGCCTASRRRAGSRTARMEAVVRLMARDGQRHLTRFGATPAVARVRARITVVAALTLVHEVIIEARRGPTPRRVEAEVVRLVAGAA